MNHPAKRQPRGLDGVFFPFDSPGSFAGDKKHESLIGSRVNQSEFIQLSLRLLLRLSVIRKFQITEF